MTPVRAGLMRCFIMIPLALSIVALAGCDRAPHAETGVEASAEAGSGAPDVVQTPPWRWSARGRTLAALDDATDVVLYSLQPWIPPDDSADWERSQRDWCLERRCLLDNRILGETPLRTTADVRLATAALRDALGGVPDMVAACSPEYRHAVGFIADGTRHQVLLCYSCGQIAMLVDGKQRGGDEQAWRMRDERALDAILRRAGVPLAAREE